MKKLLNKFQNNLILLSSIFIVLPVIIFFIGTVKYSITIIILLLIIYEMYKIKKYEKIDNQVNINYKKILIIIFIIALWLFFSGVGNFSYQNTDFEVRNAVFNDLINYNWPIINNNIGFVYYYTYWLPASLLGKIFGISIGNIALYIYSLICLCLTICLINKKLNNGKSKFNIWIILCCFIFFSGFDILVYGLNKFSFDHMEWWNELMQYSSLITSTIINCKKSSSIIFLSCLSFCYSPFATIGMIPIVLALLIKRKLLKKDIIKEMLFPLLILIIFGTFYLSADSSISVNGLTYTLTNLSIYNYIFLYLIFIIIEFLIYVFIIKDDYKKDILFITIVIELLLIPLYKMTPANDFCMRVSIGPLFILMIYVIHYLLNSNNKIKIYLLYIFLLIGSCTAIHEIGRSIYITLNNNNYLANKQIVSIMNPKTEYGKDLCNKQFYCKDINNSFFYKYIAKTSK
jgi:hypothetical protein